MARIQEKRFNKDDTHTRCEREQIPPLLRSVDPGIVGQVPDDSDGDQDVEEKPLLRDPCSIPATGGWWVRPDSTGCRLRNNPPFPVCGGGREETEDFRRPCRLKSAA